MDKLIPDLSISNALTGTELIELWQGGPESVKQSLNAIKTFITSGLIYKIDQNPSSTSGGYTGTYGLLTPATNGVAVTFTASSGYIPGTLLVWVNGELIQQGGLSSEWKETNAVSGTFTFGTAPNGGARINIQYLPQ